MTDEAKDRDWQTMADRLATRSLAEGNPTGWFDQLYAAGRAGSVDMPWDRRGPHPLLAEWTDRSPARGAGARAVVVGCGLGGDAEHLSGFGYETTGFDVAPSAVEEARSRHPESAVEYAVADLFDLPPQWRGAFDLVVEIYTVQALPPALRDAAAEAVTRLVSSGGMLLVIASVGEVGQHVVGPPWPLTRRDLDLFAQPGFEPVNIERIDGDGSSRWRAEFRRAIT